MAEAPLVLDFHGWTSNSMEEQKGGSDMLGSGWAAKSDEVGFLVVYPQGLASRSRSSAR